MRVVMPCVLMGLVLTGSLPAAAQSIDGRFGLGIEVPVLDIRHVSQDVSVPSGTAGESTTTSVGQTSTAMGLFAIGAGLDGQYGLSSQTILGARLSLRRETSKSDGSSTAAHSELSLLPRFEYYTAPDDVVRPHIGLEAGYERSTSNGSAGVTSNLWLIGPTGGVSYFPSPYWSVDVNASLYFVAGSEDISGQSVSVAGYGGVLRIALSSWFGVDPLTRSPSGPQAIAQGSPKAPGAQNTALMPANSSILDSTGGDSSAHSPGLEQVGTAQMSRQPAEDARLSLDLQEGRRLLLMPSGAKGGNKVKFTLMKVADTDDLSSCNSVALHAPKQEVVTFGVRHKRISAPSGDITLLSAEVDIERLKPLTVAPVTTAIVMTPDHWIDVCGQNWTITPLERHQLKQYLEGL